MLAIYSILLRMNWCIWSIKLDSINKNIDPSVTSQGSFYLVLLWSVHPLPLFSYGVYEQQLNTSPFIWSSSLSSTWSSMHYWS